MELVFILYLTKIVLLLSAWMALQIVQFVLKSI